MRPFLIVSLAAYALLLAYAIAQRNRFIAIFVGVILGLHTLTSTLLEPVFAGYGPWVEALLWYAQLVTYLYFLRLSRHFTPGPLYRTLVSWPASWFSASVFFALPWALVRAFGFAPWAPWLPFAIAGFGFMQSVFT